MQPTPKAFASRRTGRAMKRLKDEVKQSSLSPAVADLVLVDDIVALLLRIRYEPRDVRRSIGTQESYFSFVGLCNLRRPPFLARTELSTGGDHRLRGALSRHHGFSSASSAARSAVACKGIVGPGHARREYTTI